VDRWGFVYLFCWDMEGTPSYTQTEGLKASNTGLETGGSKIPYIELNPIIVRHISLFH
jgi:hypothetical protein